MLKWIKSIGLTAWGLYLKLWAMVVGNSIYAPIKLASGKKFSVGLLMEKECASQWLFVATVTQQWLINPLLIINQRQSMGDCLYPKAY